EYATRPAADQRPRLESPTREQLLECRRRKWFFGCFYVLLLDHRHRFFYPPCAARVSRWAVGRSKFGPTRTRSRLSTRCSRAAPGHIRQTAETRGAASRPGCSSAPGCARDA